MGVHLDKSEIRISKSETNPKEEKKKQLKHRGRLLGISDFRVFFIVSNFGFRYSDFVSQFILGCQSVSVNCAVADRQPGRWRNHVICRLAKLRVRVPTRAIVSASEVWPSK